nr:putative ORF1 [Marmot picobirnavirus]
MTQNQINYMNVVELARHNRRQEELAHDVNSETRRHNWAVEDETHRANVRGEDLRSQANAINAYSAGEVARHNQRSEYLTARDLTEKGRHNLETEALNSSDLSERVRHNIEAESQGRDSVTVSQQRADTEATRSSNQNLIGWSNYNLERQKMEVQTRQRDRELDIQQQKADIDQRNATSNRISAISDAVDRGLNYLVPKKGASNEKSKGLTGLFKDLIQEHTIRQIERGK